MPAADAGGLHRARGGKIGWAETHALHAGRGGRDRLDVIDALRGLENSVDQDRLLDLVPRLELRELTAAEAESAIRAKLASPGSILATASS